MWGVGQYCWCGKVPAFVWNCLYHWRTGRVGPESAALLLWNAEFKNDGRSRPVLLMWQKPAFIGNCLYHWKTWHVGPESTTFLLQNAEFSVFWVVICCIRCLLSCYLYIHIYSPHPAFSTPCWIQCLLSCYLLNSLSFVLLFARTYLQPSTCLFYSLLKFSVFWVVIWWIHCLLSLLFVCTYVQPSPYLFYTFLVVSDSSSSHSKCNCM